MGAFSKAVRISEHTLRYYEKEGLIVPHRTSSNIRYYTEDDRLWREYILHMKETGMSLQDLKRYSELLRMGDTGVEELTELLIQHRKKVEDK
nr:MerR family transcriptional regulator [Shouchella patagoniensis]